MNIRMLALGALLISGCAARGGGDTDAIAESLIGGLDRNKDQCVTLAEWKAASLESIAKSNHGHSEAEKEEAEAQAEKGFAVYDMNGNGCITKDEVIALQQNAKLHPPTIPGAEAAKYKSN